MGVTRPRTFEGAVALSYRPPFTMPEAHRRLQIRYCTAALFLAKYLRISARPHTLISVSYIYVTLDFTFEKYPHKGYLKNVCVSAALPKMSKLALLPDEEPRPRRPHYYPLYICFIYVVELLGTKTA
ncbi:hypothetical protein ACJJTC_003127 [Scirpophaga incertulas]